MLRGGAEAPAGQAEGEAALSRVGERAAAGLAFVRRRRVAPDESHPLRTTVNTKADARHLHTNT